MSDAVKTDVKHILFLVFGKWSINASSFHSCKKFLLVDWLWHVVYTKPHTIKRKTWAAYDYRLIQIIITLEFWSSHGSVGVTFPQKKYSEWKWISAHRRMLSFYRVKAFLSTVLTLLCFPCNPFSIDIMFATKERESALGIMWRMHFHKLKKKCFQRKEHC